MTSEIRNGFPMSFDGHCDFLGAPALPSIARAALVILISCVFNFSLLSFVRLPRILQLRPAVLKPVTSLNAYTARLLGSKRLLLYHLLALCLDVIELVSILHRTSGDAHLRSSSSSSSSSSSDDDEDVGPWVRYTCMSVFSANSRLSGVAMSITATLLGAVMTVVARFGVRRRKGMSVGDSDCDYCDDSDCSCDVCVEDREEDDCCQDDEKGKGGELVPPVRRSDDDVYVSSCVMKKREMASDKNNHIENIKKTKKKKSKKGSRKNKDNNTIMSAPAVFEDEEEEGNQQQQCDNDVNKENKNKNKNKNKSNSDGGSSKAEKKTRKKKRKSTSLKKDSNIIISSNDAILHEHLLSKEDTSSSSSSSFEGGFQCCRDRTPSHLIRNNNSSSSNNNNNNDDDDADVIARVIPEPWKLSSAAWDDLEVPRASRYWHTSDAWENPLSFSFLGAVCPHWTLCSDSEVRIPRPLLAVLIARCVVWSVPLLPAVLSHGIAGMTAAVYPFFAVYAVGVACMAAGIAVLRWAHDAGGDPGRDGLVEQSSDDCGNDVDNGDDDRDHDDTNDGSKKKFIKAINDAGDHEASEGMAPLHRFAKHALTSVLLAIGMVFLWCAIPFAINAAARLFLGSSSWFDLLSNEFNERPGFYEDINFVIEFARENVLGWIHIVRVLV